MTETLQQIAEWYEDRPVIRSLIQLIPFGVGSAVDTGIAVRLSNIREERLRSFFAELAEGEVDLPEELLKSDDFIHCYVETVRAALSSRREEKVQYFARLLRGTFATDHLRDVDEYEEFLGVLEDLTFREIQVLVALDQYLSQNEPPFDERDAQEIKQYWNECLDFLSDEADVPRSEITAYLRRIGRSGLLDRVRVSASEREVANIGSGMLSVVVDDELVVPNSRYERLRETALDDIDA
jgi:DNA-binding MarR family transcriptional regulator